MGRLKRYQDWPTRLEKAIRSHDRRRFRYGWHDCCISPVNCLKAMTGVDIIKEFGIAYTTEEEAKAFLTSKRGMVNMLKWFAKALNVTAYSNVNRVKRGDIVLVGLEGGNKALGIIDLTGRRALVASSKGWKSYDFTAILMAWDIN